MIALLVFRHPVKLNDVSWSCEAPIGNLADNSIGCHDNLLILSDRFVEFPDTPLFLSSGQFQLRQHFIEHILYM